MKQRIIKYFLLLLVFCTVGCVKESLEDCFSGLKLKFIFTLHDEEPVGNLFGDKVRHVRAYIFNEAGVLHSIVTDRGDLTNNYTMDIALEPGRYSVVAWASGESDYAKSYVEAHGDDLTAVPPLLSKLVVGKSTTKDMVTLLDCVAMDGGYAENVKPRDKNFADLYFGAVGGRSSDGKSVYSIIPVEIGVTGVVEREVELIRNTNIIRLTVSGLDAFDMDFNCYSWVSGTNARYNFDNSIAPTALSVHFMPVESTYKDFVFKSDMRVQRMQWSQKYGDALTLHFKDLLTNKYVTTNLDIISLLKRARDDKGEYIYKNQEDFDRIYIHPIHLSFQADLSLKIYVHNWEVKNVKPEL